MRSSTRAILGSVALLACAADARAQSVSTDKFSLAVNAGFQQVSRDVDGSGILNLYEEEGPFTSRQSLGSKPIFDVSADYRVSGSFSIGAGWSMYTDSSPMTIAAVVPHPLFAGQPRSVAAEAADVKHTTQTINVIAAWRYPFSQKVDLIVSGGPSIFFVTQDVMQGLTIAPESFPFSAAPVVNAVTLEEASKTVLGLNVGVDAAYMINRRYGVGVGVRYTYGSASFDELADSLTVGGLQVLGGLRLRF